VSLHLYDTAARSLRPFEPLVPGEASIYLCGLTVQGPPHIGHVRNWVTIDILRRWLEHNGSKVTYVRNVTDIDDKILNKSAGAGEQWWQLAYRNEIAIHEAQALLGVQPPSYEPRATGHITEMIELMERLVASGHAYASEGDVFFDIASYPAYGALSGQRVGEMQPAGDSVGDSRKRDPRDFALWKGHKDGEPESASWPTPWGRGRPGWHLECSAMATKYLGPSFDIHGGGLDLVFPHHENEIAQSRAAGDGFAQYWLHNAMLTMAGEKMSKSVGNTLSVVELAKEWRPVELRYYLGSAHYRSVMEYSPEALLEAATAYRRIENFLERAEANVPMGIGAATLAPEFGAALDDDLAVPRALAVIHDTVRAGNAALDAGNSQTLLTAMIQVQAMTRILGFSPADWLLAGTGAGAKAVIDDLVQLVLNQRVAARERKDFTAADQIRDQLAEAGVVVEDTPYGPRWTIKEAE
jgi:cysteinyl-tRNA synthetase